MSIWSKIGCVGACVSLLIYGNAMGMETDKVEKTESNSADDSPAWPTMAVDGTAEHPEGEHLAKHHATARDRGFWKHVPKDARELDRFYRLCKGKRGISEKNMKDIWRGVLSGMEEEIIARCLDGDLYFIDKYLCYLDNFVSLTASHPDKKFVSQLYTSDYFGGLRDSLNKSLSIVLYRIESAKAEDHEYTLESTHLLYALDRMDRMLSNIGDTGFFDSFYRLELNTKYQNTPEFQALLKEFGRTLFSDGFTIIKNP